MKQGSGHLAKKIIGILSLFVFFALAAISLTLTLTNQLEGMAAALNEAGSLRTRCYRMGYLMRRGFDDNLALINTPTLMAELFRFDKVLYDLRHGDQLRPIARPGNTEIETQLAQITAYWQEELRPAVVRYYLAETLSQRQNAFRMYDAQLENFVLHIDQIVQVMEQNDARSTALLHTVQVILLLLCIASGFVLFRLFSRLVIVPVAILHRGMQRMIDNDLSVRLPENQRDELGELAEGFNRMAKHLQNVYETLEERVAVKTKRLEEQKRELTILYETTSFLNEATSLERLSQEFLHRMQQSFGASSSVLCLDMDGDGSRQIIQTRELSSVHSKKNVCTNCHGELSLPVTVVFSVPKEAICHTGIAFAMQVITKITYKKQEIGVFNLLFENKRDMLDTEKNLLEMLGQHLGATLESLRLQSQATQLAVLEERSHLAQELHDSIAQGLVFINMQVQMLEASLADRQIDLALQHAEQVRAGVQESYGHVRELLANFRTRSQHADLHDALESTLKKFETQTGISAALDFSTNIQRDPPRDTQIMHIIEESLSNIRKHAKATEVHIHVTKTDAKQIEISVDDNGTGFDSFAATPEKEGHHLGLTIMQERAEHIKGRCDIRSTLGKGTKVRLVFPLDA